MVNDDGAPFVHRIRVRYGDCDMQGVVFNANYFAYIDDAMDMWLQNTLGADYLARFDYAVKKITMEWTAPARARDIIELCPSVTRWGRTSFDVRVALTSGDRALGEAHLVLISIAPATYTPAPIPGQVRQSL
jgi:acyl-CoA thioester hydrolase